MVTYRSVGLSIYNNTPLVVSYKVLRKVAVLPVIVGVHPRFSLNNDFRSVPSVYPFVILLASGRRSSQPATSK